MEPPDFEPVAIRLYDSLGRGSGPDTDRIVGALQAAFDLGHQRGRADAIESAAKVADGWLDQFGGASPEFVTAQKWANDAVKDIADAIRALSAKEDV